jgi:hypothetical protein
VAEAAAADDKPLADVPKPPVAAPTEKRPARAEPARRTTKIAKKPARVKRVGAKPAMTRPKARPKKKKACADLSCV